MKFRKGQILNFAYEGNIFQKLIRWRNYFIYGNKGYSHSGIIIDVKNDFVEIAEALDQGFITDGYSKGWLNERIADKTIAIGESKIPLKNVKKHTEKYIGTPYGWFDIWNIIFATFFKINSRSFRFFKGAKYLICSEAVARILYDASNKKINFEEEFGIPYDMIEPMHLFLSKQIKWQH